MIIEADVYLEHFGVKGMKWGVRNESGTVHRLQGKGPVIDPRLHQTTKTAAKEVSALISDRYGFQIHTVNPITDRAELEFGTVGYVQGTPGQKGGAIFITKADVTKRLKDAENEDWFADGTGNVRGLLTHESAHAIFHAEQQTKVGFFRAKVVGGNIEARDTALKAALGEAKRSGISPEAFTTKISGYSAAANSREEAEAEMFAQYHWSPNPPSFVKTWGETLHQEMGLDPTPFRKVRKP